MFVCGYLMAYSQSKVTGTVIGYSPSSSDLYIGSPSIAVLANGHYLASHDFFWQAFWNILQFWCVARAKMLKNDTFIK